MKLAESPVDFGCFVAGLAIPRKYVARRPEETTTHSEGRKAAAKPPRGLAAAAMMLGPSPLTAREREVLIASTSGAGIEQIAQTLRLSDGTVRNKISSAISKRGARNRADAVRIAGENGWL